ncbi:adenylate/guanylate cyclase domain-containing protein [Methylobacterium durans]|uniref:Adenylate/guanylate cyclase domain-containing protein n=1 Tax=Methylobacterium durans TaxID=2202825 RepID=A0A2U8W2B4_9HYPH|nr:adenylate/guanylate cyclase domain-containing protein [Methylobacterium durans]AWN40219.1 adenylate/guanylate cyclase domain-containing protein [Methylobacterium durans]
MDALAQPHDLIDWILRHALATDDLGGLLAGICERLSARGVPLWRASLDLPTIDPHFRALTHKWWRDQPVTVGTFLHGPEQEQNFQRSVIYHLLSRDLEEHRWRLEAGEGAAEFELLASLREAGGTDYVMRLVTFGDGGSVVRGFALSFATDRPGGFSGTEIEAVGRLIPALGLAAYRTSAALTAASALSVYLGANTAQRVLAGEIRRGEGERIAATILFADLKGFTDLTERADALQVVAWLNEHFEAIGAAVAAQGGEILKFLGDGLLAVFPVTEVGRFPCASCEAALRAAEEAVAGNDALNAERRRRGEPALAVDVALHFGEVVYGNVGASRRLDFTVIGRAVNETCRMEALCDELGRSIVLSEDFARRSARETIRLGAFGLRGVRGERIVYGLA